MCCTHIHVWRWICGLFVSGVDVGVDVFDDFGDLRVVFHQFLDPVDGVHDGGVVSALKFLADFFE